MDLGRILIFIPLCIYLFYSYKKSKLNIYLILGVFSWHAAFHSGQDNIYQFFQEPFKSIVDLITDVLVLIALIPYFKKSINEYKEYENNK